MIISLHQANRQFKQYIYDSKNVNGIPANDINTITEDKFGYLWLGTSGNGTVRFDKKTGIFSIPVKQERTIDYAATMGKGDTLLVGRAGGGLLKINTCNLSFVTDKRYDYLETRLPHASITSIFKDHNNNIWIGTWDKKVYRISEHGIETTIDPNANEKKLEQDDFVAFAEDNQHNIWMAGKKNWCCGIKHINRKVSAFSSSIFAGWFVKR